MIYYIRNTVNEYQSSISGYFPSLPEALKALDKCYDWYRSESSGKIFKIEMGLNKKPVLVYERK